MRTLHFVIGRIRALHWATGDFATGDFAFSYDCGNTENFNPGGWGGNQDFVGADFSGVFLHEMGHAFGFPHWRLEHGPGVSRAKDVVET